MRSRLIILCLILLILSVTVLAASAKLRATPKYDRIQVGMTHEQVEEILGKPDDIKLYLGGYGPGVCEGRWETAEGTIMVRIAGSFGPNTPSSVRTKSITPRGPLERLAWLAGRR